MELIDVEFSENPDPRCACVLLLDTSGSMSGGPIQALNEGLKIFSETLVKDSLAARRVEVALELQRLAFRAPEDLHEVEHGHGRDHRASLDHASVAVHGIPVMASGGQHPAGT